MMNKRMALIVLVVFSGSVFASVNSGTGAPQETGIIDAAMAWLAAWWPF